MMTRALAKVRNSARSARTTCVSVAMALLCIGAIAISPSAAQPSGSRSAANPAAKDTAPRIATGDVGSGIALRDTRVEAFPGRTLLVPIGPVDAEGRPSLATPPDWRPTSLPEVALVTDEVLTASLWRVRGRASESTTSIDPWLPPPFTWSTQPWAQTKEAADPSEVVLWFLEVEMPPRPVGRWLRIGARKLPLEWVDLPTDPRQPDIDFAALSPTRIQQLTDLTARLSADAQDPFRAWRIALTREFYPFMGYSAVGEAPLPALDLQFRDRALASVARIRSIDRALGDRIVAMLAAIVESPDGELLPAWPPDPTHALELFSAVLREGRTDAEIRADAEAFLRTAPPAIAWIVNESGPDGPTGAPTCAVAIADRSGQECIASLAPQGMQADNATALPPFRSAILTVDPAFPGDITTTRLTARAGLWSTQITALAGSVGARPPGVTLGPLLPDWNHASWARSAAPRIDPTHITMAMLQRQVDAEGVARGWELIIEAQRTETSPDDAVTVWLGPMGQTTAAIRIASDGSAEIVAGVLTGEGLPVNINSTPERWIAQIVLPPELTAGPRLRIALERIDARGVRSAWPRPMLPGQPEPGRLAIDLTSW